MSESSRIGLSVTNHLPCHSFWGTVSVGLKLVLGRKLRGVVGTWKVVLPQCLGTCSFYQSEDLSEHMCNT